MAPGPLLGRSWPLGRLLVSLGALLGRSWGVPGSSWCRLGSLLGRPGALLGVILGSRGALFGACWSPLRAGLQYHGNIEIFLMLSRFSRLVYGE